jgi:hypothetical protein
MPRLFETPTANIATIVILAGWLLAFVSGLFDFTWSFLSFGMAIACTLLIDRLGRDTMEDTGARRERAERVPQGLRVGVALLMFVCILILAISLFQGLAR